MSMEKSTKINIRVNEEIKKDAENLFNELGISMSTAINMFLKQSILKKGIPFEIRKEYPNYETAMAIKETFLEKYNEESKTFNSVDKLFEELDSSD